MRISSIVLVLAASLSTHAMARSSLEELHHRLQGPIAGAHQGGIYGAFPNTLKAFDDARKAGVGVVEMDLRNSKDNVPVVFHDEKLNRWTYCRGYVNEKTAAQLKNCEFPNHPEARIPFFEEVLQWSQGRVVINAEFKESAVIRRALELVKKYNAYSWVYFQAKSNREDFKLAQSIDPQVALLYVIQDTHEDLAWALSQSPALLIVELHPETAQEAAIEAIRQSGRLSSQNSWHYSRGQELFGATCSDVFARQIDIAISNRPQGCVEQEGTFQYR